MKKNSRIAGLIILLIIPLSIITYALDGSLLKIPLYLYSSLYFAISMGIATVYTSGIQVRLVTLSHILTSKFSRSSSEKIVQVEAQAVNRSDENVKLFSTLAEIYQVLMESCDEINVCCGIQLLMGFAFVFFLTLFASFTAFTDYANQGFFLTSTITSAGFCIYYNFLLTAVISACSMLETEVIVNDIYSKLLT